jgi:hypothetical protein
LTTHVLSTESVGLRIGSGVPKLHPVVVQSGPAVLTAGTLLVGLMAQLEPVQLSANRLTEPAGVGPSLMTDPAPPMLSPPHVRFLITVPAAFFDEPQMPPGVPLVKSRIVGVATVVVVVVEVVVVVVGSVEVVDDDVVVVVVGSVVVVDDDVVVVVVGSVVVVDDVVVVVVVGSVEVVDDVVVVVVVGSVEVVDDVVVVVAIVVLEVLVVVVVVTSGAHETATRRLANSSLAQAAPVNTVPEPNVSCASGALTKARTVLRRPNFRRAPRVFKRGVAAPSLGASQLPFPICTSPATLITVCPGAAALRFARRPARIEQTL